MQYTGTIAITDELTLSNPTLNINSIMYDWATDKVYIEIYFNEGDGLFNHSRTFEFDNVGGGELSSTDIYNYINNHEVLSAFS